MKSDAFVGWDGPSFYDWSCVPVLPTSYSLSRSQVEWCGGTHFKFFYIVICLNLRVSIVNVITEQRTWSWILNSVDASRTNPPKSLITVETVTIFGIVSFSVRTPATIPKVLDWEDTVSPSNSCRSTWMYNMVAVWPPSHDIDLVKHIGKYTLAWFRDSVLEAAKWCYRNGALWINKNRLKN